jgi:hypothetical protein
MHVIMHRLVIALCLVSSIAVAKGSYLDNDKTVTQDCGKDPEATIVGNENTITFIGTCTRVRVMGNENKVTIASVKELTVDGNDNTIDVDATDAIGTAGNHNTVTWKKGISGKKPGVQNPGTGNKISQKK